LLGSRGRSVSSDINTWPPIGLQPLRNRLFIFPQSVQLNRLPIATTAPLLIHNILPLITFFPARRQTALVSSTVHPVSNLQQTAIRIAPIAKQHAGEKSHAIATIFCAGLVCGILDITAAFVTWTLRGVSPLRLLQAIASGLLGVAAYHGGWATAALGCACHFFIAFSVATVFYIASRKLPFLTRRPILSGFSFSIAVYIVMYWIVMPLSRLQPMPFSLSRTAIAILTHMFCVGLPISLIVSRCS
jgi:hypothetical protein